MTAVSCRNTPDRKAETWQKQLAPLERLEFAPSDAAKGITAAVEPVAEARHGDESAPPLDHGLDDFHTACEAHCVLARQWRRAEAAWDQAETAAAPVEQAKHQGVDARGPAPTARAACWNCRPFRSGLRKGICPYQALGLELPTFDFWELLHSDPEQLTQQLSTSGKAT